ncbi:MAG: thioredoxin family protein [Candidatus Heimdallarchaeota archaeon]|nr:thioredoxin family protein [Candidatus Heimdallarchaeota archaeon]
MSKIKIEIFGKGCKNCNILENNARKAADNTGEEIEVFKITEMDEMLDRGVFKTPGLAIEGKVVSSGRVLSPDKIKKLIADYKEN